MKYERILITIIAILGFGTGVLFVAAPHDFAHDPYRAEVLRPIARPTTIHDGSRSALHLASTPAPTPIRKDHTLQSGSALKSASNTVPLSSQKDAPMNVTFISLIHGSALDAMLSEEAAGRLSFSVKEFPGMGVFMESLQGRKNADGKFWFLYVNGISSELGPSHAVVEPGDRVEWRYQESY